MLYCCLPLYHNNALTVALGSTINAGATLALGKSFSASKFWDDVIRYKATAFISPSPSQPRRGDRTQGSAQLIVPPLRGWGGEGGK